MGSLLFAVYTGLNKEVYPMNEVTMNPELAAAVEIAQFRYGIIAPVIQGLFPDPSIMQFCQRVTERPLKLPDGSEVQYQPKTVSRWVWLYRKGGFDALMPHSRADKGTTRALTDSAIEEIYRVKQEYPRLNATQIHAHLIEKGFIPATVNVCAVQRFIRRNDLKSARNPNMKDRKQFEESAFGRMWQADTCYLPHIMEDGKSRRVYAIAIIDDHSRLLVGGELFYNDNAENFQKVLKDAIATYGLPNKLYVDNGCSYANEQLSLICGSLGIVLLHTKVRDGASKAKIERYWRTMKETWLYKQDIASIESLQAFNEAYREHKKIYNTTMHAGIKCTPFERYKASADQIKQPESREWLNENFLNRIQRKVKKDSTVSIKKTSYDVPAQFIGQTVEIRYEPSDMSTAFVLYEGQHYPIRQTDRNENCRTKRSNGIELDYSKAGEV